MPSTWDNLCTAIKRFYNTQEHCKILVYTTRQGVTPSPHFLVNFTRGLNPGGGGRGCQTQKKTLKTFGLHQKLLLNLQHTVAPRFPWIYMLEQANYRTSTYGCIRGINMSGKNSSFIYWNIYSQASLILTLIICSPDKACLLCASLDLIEQPCVAGNGCATEIASSEFLSWC